MTAPRLTAHVGRLADQWRSVNPDEQRNTRLGGTISIPLGKFQSVKVIYSTGAATRRGTDFDSFSVNWQLARY